MTDTTINILVLCTGNSARSILGEGLINSLADKAGKDIRGFSAGSQPKGQVHPVALEVLKENGITIADARSKSWDEFADASGPAMDVVITVCSSAAGEVCPIWPGAPVTVHWGLPDPAAATGSAEDIHTAFQTAYDSLHERISRLLEIVGQDMEPRDLQARLQDIHDNAG